MKTQSTIETEVVLGTIPVLLEFIEHEPNWHCCKVTSFHGSSFHYGKTHMEAVNNAFEDFAAKGFRMVWK